jgi:RHS repeat-associated protein
MYRPATLGSIVSNVSYGPSNQLLGMTYNEITETRTYNSLLQLTSVTSGQVNMQYNFPAAPSNNGQACLATDLITGEQVVYSYDTLKRLPSASAYTFSGSPSTNCTSTSSTATWSETYSFDGYGNLWNKVGTGGALSQQIGYNDANNRIGIAGAQYEANGNLLASGLGVLSYIYDAENRMTQAISTSNGTLNSGYDSQNKRIWTWAGSTDSNGNASGYTIYYYGVKGERLGQYNVMVTYNQGSHTASLVASTTSTETYFGPRRLAPLDRLGSARIVNGFAASYYAFGEDKSTNQTGDAWRFGTYWRDSISGLDYADQRSYSSQFGRFMTPGPNGASAHTSSPKSWNRYGYVLGDPINTADPSEMDTTVCEPLQAGDYQTACYTISDGQTSTNVPADSTMLNTESVTVTATQDPVNPYQADDPGSTGTLSYTGQSSTSESSGGSGVSYQTYITKCLGSAKQTYNQALAAATSAAQKDAAAGFLEGELIAGLGGCLAGSLSPLGQGGGFLAGPPGGAVTCASAGLWGMLFAMTPGFVSAMVSYDIAVAKADASLYAAYETQVSACYQGWPGN